MLKPIACPDCGKEALPHYRFGVNGAQPKFTEFYCSKCDWHGNPMDGIWRALKASSAQPGVRYGAKEWVGE